MTHTVLLIDDDPHILSGLQRVLHKEPYAILTAATAEEAAGILADQSVDLIVCDEEMPGMSGTEFLSHVAHQCPDTVRIVLTGHPSVPATLRAINEGKVYHFFTKPCNEIDLAIAIRHALTQKDFEEKSRELLEVTRRQSRLMDEVRLTRRLRGAPREGGPPVVETAPEGLNRQELLTQMDEAVRRGQELVSALKHGKRTDASVAPEQQGTPPALDTTERNVGPERPT